MRIKSMLVLLFIMTGHYAHSEPTENNYWCKYECNSTGKTTLKKGSSPVAACHISYAKCYDSCVDNDNDYAGCKYIEHGTILNTDN